MIPVERPVRLCSGIELRINCYSHCNEQATHVFVHIVDQVHCAQAHSFKVLNVALAQEEEGKKEMRNYSRKLIYREHNRRRKFREYNLYYYSQGNWFLLFPETTPLSFQLTNGCESFKAKQTNTGGNQRMTGSERKSSKNFFVNFIPAE